MITSIRKNLQSPAVHFIIFTALFAMVIVPLLAALLGERTTKDNWAIKVNETTIGIHTFEHELQKQRQYVSAIRAQYGQFADYIIQMYGLNNIRLATANTLINRALLDQLSHSLGIVIPSDYLVEKLNDKDFALKHLADTIPPYVYDERGSLNSLILRDYLQKIGVDSDTFEQQIKDALARNATMDVLKEYHYVPQFELEHVRKKDNYKKQFAYRVFDKADFLKEAKKESLTQEEIREFYTRENNVTRRYVVPEQRKGVMWKFSSDEYGIGVDKAEVEHYYNAHRRDKFVDEPAKVEIRKIVVHITDDVPYDAAYTHAERIYQDVLENPDNFAQIAREFSQDESTASNGGLIEPFVRGTQPLALDKAAFVLQNDGDISDIITLDDSLVIIQRVSRQPIRFKPLSEVDNDIERTLKKEKFLARFEHDARSVNLSDSVNRSSFVDKHNGEKSLIEWLNRDEGSHAAELFRMQKGQYTVYIDKEDGYIVRLDDIKSAYTPELQDIKEQVVADLYEHRAESLLKHAVNEAYKKALKNEWDKPPVITRYLLLKDKNDAEVLAKRGLSLAQIGQMDILGATIKQVDGDKTYIVRLQNMILESSDEQNDDEKRLAQLKKQREETFVGGIIAHLHRIATINTSDLATITSENWA